MHYIELRKKYPTFIYKSFAYRFSEKDLKIFFDFRIPPSIQFNPKVVIQNVTKKDVQKVGENAFKNLVFHVGLIELLSYWKATCSPEIIIEAGGLDIEQIAWWKNLIQKGMGEFFFQNKINFTRSDFLEIAPTSRHMYSSFARRPKEQILIPVGGGKDAIVTLELLKKFPHRAFALNPKQEQKAILKIAQEKNPLVMKRTIDPKLLELNRKGFLNGHTPFSAYLAFLSILGATLFNYKYIALSNERSSNEGNVKYLGELINHQYSKSFEFEKKFREYSKKYLVADIEYFSFLRPLYELQIAKIFARYPQYLNVFLSCNEANKTQSGTRKPTGKWCGKCAKCLFIFLALRPFVGEKTVVSIFKKNLLQDKTLAPLLDQLTGKRKFKPFECVGTIKESRAALSLRPESLISSWNKHHFLPPSFSKLLKEAQ